MVVADAVVGLFGLNAAMTGFARAAPLVLFTGDLTSATAKPTVAFYVVADPQAFSVAGGGS